MEMDLETAKDILIADRVWIATALLQRQNLSKNEFRKDEIRKKMEEEGLAEGIDRRTLSAHLDQHCVANVPPSSGKYRMLYETTPGGNLRLFRPGDLTHPSRVPRRKPSKIVPRREQIPEQYWPLLDWYEAWIKESHAPVPPIRWEDDPLIRLIGSGKHIWADEHADEYVENLRREEPA
jgi:hypothetical protein